MRLAVVAAVCLSMVGLAVAADARASMKMQTDIPAQGLGPALRTLAKDRGFQIVFRTEVVGDARTHGATGDLTTPEALTKLLEGTSLTYAYLDENTITIVRAELGSGSAADRQSPVTGGGSSQSGDNKEGKKRNSFRLAQVDPGSSSGAAPVKAAPASTDESKGDESKGSGGLSEIIVTAEKRSERLIDVPTAVTAVDAEALVQHGQFKLQDYFTTIPGVSEGRTDRDSGISIRGLDSGGGSATVSVLLDDLPLGALVDIDPSDIARIEVLRGPQGTLYGSNAMGGLIKYVSIDPSFDGVSGHAEVGSSAVASGDSLGYYVRGGINLPVSSDLALRLGGFSRKDPGYVDDIQSHQKDVNSVDSRGAQAALLWKPSDDFSLKLNGLYQNSLRNGSDMVDSTLGDLNQSTLIGTGTNRTQLVALGATIHANLGGFDITSASAYSEDKIRALIDFYPVFGTPSGYNYYPNIDTVSQEIRLSRSLGSIADIMIGGIYSKTKKHGGEDVDFRDPVTGVVTTPATQVYYEISEFDQAERAVFGNLTFHLTDRLSVQVGGRESRIAQLTNYADYGPFFAHLDGSPAITDGRAEASVFTYLGTALYKITDNWNAYARTASGYRPGGPNLNCHFLAGVSCSIEPDQTTNYEVGTKGSVMDHMLSFDLSAYYIKWKNIQTGATGQTADGTSLTYVTNAGRAKSEGIEASFELRPAPGLSIRPWVAYNIAELTEDFPVGNPTFGQKGDRLPSSPRVSGVIDVEQQIKLPDNLMATMGSTTRYVGSRAGGFPDSAAIARQFLPSYWQEDVHVGLQKSQWSGTFYVNNATNRRGVQIAGFFFAQDIAYIAPRTIGFTLRRDF